MNSAWAGWRPGANVCSWGERTCEVWRMSANDPTSSSVGDDRYRRVVVLLLLSVRPATLTEAEIEREIVDDESFAARDAVAQALRDLAAAGVVHRCDRFVRLTRAATVTAGLLEAW